MSAAIAGIYDPGAARTRPRQADLVELALAPDGDPVVRTLGPLTLGFTGGSAHSDGTVVCVVSGGVDAGAALAAYRRLGDDAPLELRDAFTIVIWDDERRRGLLARDHAGLSSLFYARLGAGLAFATEIRTLLRLLPSRPPPDELAVVRWLARSSEAPGRTFYEGVARLGAAARIVIDDVWRHDRYWRPRYTPAGHADADEAAELLRAELSRSVRRSAGEASPGVLLSGGFDSGYVASLAARAGLAPRAYSALFPDHPAVDESRSIEQLVAELGMPLSAMPVPAASPFPAAFEYIAEWEVPLPVMGHYYARALMERAARDGVRVVLDGEGGDELFGFESYVIADLMLGIRLPRAVSIARELAGSGKQAWRRTLQVLVEDGLRGAVPYDLQRAVRRRRDATRYAPDWLTRRSARLLREVDDPWAWKRLAGPRWWAHFLHHFTDGADMLGRGDYLRRRARQAGVAAAHPLMSVDLVELVLRLPPELALGGRDNRALARRSAAGVMPETARRRTEKSYFNELYNDCLAGELEFLNDLLLGADAELRAYVEPGVVHGLLERVPAPARRPWSGWAQQVWRLATMETWLRSQADPGYPERALAQIEAAGRV